jgi:hypothetical protein
MATLPDIPDLPTPITPDRPSPSDLPVEPDAGIGLTLAENSDSIRIGVSGSLRTGTALHFMANRQFMHAATFRWPYTPSSVRIN